MQLALQYLRRGGSRGLRCSESRKEYHYSQFQMLGSAAMTKVYPALSNAHVQICMFKCTNVQTRKHANVHMKMSSYKC